MKNEKSGPGWFKRLFTHLKFKIMAFSVKGLLAKLLEAFKQKNSAMWAVVFSIASVLQFGLAAVVSVIVPGLQLPAELLSLDWILATFNIALPDNVTDVIMWVLVAITGAKTYADLPAKDQEKKLEQTKELIARKEKRAMIREERKKAKEGNS